MNRTDRVSPIAFVLLATVSLLLTSSSPAGADPAGPTDYETVIVSIDPPSDRFDLDVIGGDSFLRLSNRGGAIEVVGYRGEPYLRFEPDGRVLRNERSPSRWLNDDRFGDADLPLIADHEADPEWIEVADDGRYAWHDHRAHWMNPAPPPGASPGDVILEAVVPLVVDGGPVSVAVRSTMLSRPSTMPAALAALASAAAVVLVARRRPRSTTARAVAILLLIAASAATAAGIVAVTSVPPETGPSLLLWALPATATLLAAAALVVGDGAPSRRLLGFGLQLAASAELAAWAFVRRDALRRALIPSDLPAALDRVIIGATAATGMVAAIVAATAVLAVTRAPQADQGA